MPHTPLLAAALIAPALVLPVRAETLWQDDFQAQRRYDIQGARSWTIDRGRCAFRAGRRDIRLNAPIAPVAEVVIESEIVLRERNGSNWTWAGVALYLDPTNHWQLMLVEGPDGRRYLELIEKLNGVHQAQGGGGTVRTRLASQQTGDLQSWEYDEPYTVRLAVNPVRIEGTVTAADGRSWQRTYSFARGQAVKNGTPGLVASGMAGEFRYLRADGQRPRPGESLRVTQGDAGTVVVLEDREHSAASRLAEALKQVGYGVTLASWDELDATPLPYRDVDLFVLADARRTPLCARDAVVTLAHCGGKVLAIGAPAFSELLARTPDGWRRADDWAAAYVGRLQTVSVPIPPDAWRHTARFPERQSDITLDTSEGERCWRVSADLDGWDGFGLGLAEAFGEDRSLLTFEARGDRHTTQLYVELREQDRSRWIATVPLSPDWSTHLLLPSDFSYWDDSDAEGRGGAGDRVRPENAAAMTIGLSQSHTSKVKKGRHTYWIRDIATAKSDEISEPDFRMPDMEALCPSYKLYPMPEIAFLRSANGAGGAPIPWSHPGYSPVWRERGRGFGRARSWRWVPVLEAFDAEKRKRGALISLLLGDGSHPNAMWANVAVTDPKHALADELLEAVVRTAQRMVNGCFLLEGGAELFSYRPGETIELGARVLNTGRADCELEVELTVRDRAARPAFSERATLVVAPGQAADARWEWRPDELPVNGCTVETVLRTGGGVIDRITHPIARLRTTPASRDEFVRVEGSHFMLGDRKWFFKGINYRPGWVGGYPHLNLTARECYDPEIVERDFAFLESIGVNALSAVHALMPPDPDAPNAYRDQLDFLERCERHGIKCFFFLPFGRPYRGADLGELKAYIERAELKDHPTIMCWELAWEPIENPWRNGMDFFAADWNAWVAERYGSIDHAVEDWQFDPPRTDEGNLAVPPVEMFREPGEWRRMCAAFRRAFSDVLSAKYRDIVRPLRGWDPKHLISFRAGGCGVPSGIRFAHAHSVGVAKHVDFLNPEGYSLRTTPWGEPTPPADIRRGGLVTLYYRFISREKPIVWMEFGHTVNGYHREWAPKLVHVSPAQLQAQRGEIDGFYRMILESGARGAAPWWLPGGFRVGENSDFGLIEPDGTPRPAIDVLRRAHPQFDDVVHQVPTHVIDIDFDGRYADGWEIYSERYLRAVEADEVPYLRTAGTGTDSTNCPLLAVGGGPHNGHNPPQFLNAELNRLELKTGDSDWWEFRSGETIEVAAGAAVLCRASVGNTGEAAWTAPASGGNKGRVFLAGRAEYGHAFQAPIAADTPFLADAEVAEFTLIPAVRGEVKVSFEMTAEDRAWFGERRAVTIVARD